MRGKVFALAALVAVAGTAAAANAKVAVKPVWLAPVEISPRSDYSVVDQDVAVDSRDDVLAVWSGKSGVQARYRPAGGAWQNPLQLDGCGVGATPAFDSAGDATVAWLRCTSTLSQMTTAVRRVDGSWRSPVVLSTPGRAISYPRLAVAASGAAVASWIEYAGSDAVVEASVRAAGSDDWSRAEQVSSVGADAEDSFPAVDDAGDAVVGFTRFDPAGAIVWAAFKPAGAGWQRAVNLSVPGDYAYDIRVAMRPDGTAIALWDENGEGRLAMRSASTGAWSQQAPFPLYTVEAFAADGVGDVVAAWQSDRVMFSELPAGSGTWTQPAAIPATEAGALGLTIGFDGTRGLVAAWAREDTYGHGSLVAARRQAGSAGWDAPATLGNVTGFFWNVHTAVDLDGDAIAALETGNGASVVTAILDAAAPKVAPPSVPQTGRVGRKLSFAAKASDISPVTLRWYFGDRHNAAGSAVTHVFRKAGRFAVSLVATDAAGHAVTVVRTSVRIRG
jgi:hypothetical protein